MAPGGRCRWAVRDSGVESAIHDPVEGHGAGPAVTNAARTSRNTRHPGQPRVSRAATIMDATAKGQREDGVAEFDKAGPAAEQRNHSATAAFGCDLAVRRRFPGFTPASALAGSVPDTHVPAAAPQLFCGARSPWLHWVGPMNRRNQYLLGCSCFLLPFGLRAQLLGIDFSARPAPARVSKRVAYARVVQ